MKLFTLQRILILVLLLKFSLTSKLSSKLNNSVNSKASLFNKREAVLNFYDNNNSDSTLSCKVKLSYETKVCNFDILKGQKFSSAKFIIESGENAGDDLVSSLTGKSDFLGSPSGVGKESEKLPDRKFRFSEKESDSNAYTSTINTLSNEFSNKITQASNIVKNALSRIGHAFRFRFAAFSEEAYLNSKEKNDEKANDAIKGTKANQCDNKIKRLAYMGNLDLRYVKECEIKMEGNPAGSFSLKLNINSRETEDSLQKKIEIIVPSKGLTETELKTEIETMTKTCKDMQAKVNQITNDLEKQYCLKKDKDVLNKCDKIEDPIVKTKCEKFESDITTKKEKVNSKTNEVEKIKKQLDECNKNKLNHEADTIVSDKESKSNENTAKKLSAEKEKLKKELEEKEKLKKKQDEEVLAKKQEQDELSKKNKDLQAQISEGEELQSKKNQENKTSEQNADTFRKQIQEINKDINKLTSKEKQLQEQHNNNALENSQQTSEGNDASKNGQQANDKVTQLEQQVNEINTKLQNKLSELDNLNKSESDSKSKSQQENNSSNQKNSNDFTQLSNEVESVCNKVIQVLGSALKENVSSACNAAKEGKEEWKNTIEALSKSYSM